MSGSYTFGMNCSAIIVVLIVCANLLCDVFPLPLLQYRCSLYRCYNIDVPSIVVAVSNS